MWKDLGWGGIRNALFWTEYENHCVLPSSVFIFDNLITIEPSSFRQYNSIHKYNTQRHAHFVFCWRHQTQWNCDTVTCFLLRSCWGGRLRVFSDAPQNHSYSNITRQISRTVCEHLQLMQFSSIWPFPLFYATYLQIRKAMYVKFATNTVFKWGTT